MAAAGGDVEAALKEADKAAKKQKVCSSSSEAAVDQLLQVGAGAGKMEVLGRSISNIRETAVPWPLSSFFPCWGGQLAELCLQCLQLPFLWSLGVLPACLPAC